MAYEGETLIVSFAWIDYALKEGPMDPTERYVYLDLCNRADADGVCFPSMSTIMRETRLSESTVRRSIASLEKQGWISVVRGNGAGHPSIFTVQRVSPRTPSSERVSRRRVSPCTPKGCHGDGEGCHGDKSPTPPIRSNRQEPSLNPPSAGGSGEFMAATWLFQELGFAAGAYDVQILAQVIAYAAREAKTTAEKTSRFLLDAAQAAIKRGELVNTFWFKNRKFTQEESNVQSRQNHRSPARQRVDNNRRAIAEALAARGIRGPWDHHGNDSPPMAESGHGTADAGVSSGLGETSPEILPPSGSGRDHGAPH